MNITRNAIVTLLIASMAGFAAPARAQCIGDIIPDGQVDGIDLGVLLGYWGPRTSAAFSIASDLDQNGIIDGTDLGVLLGAWGACRPFVASVSPNWAAPAGGAVVTLTGRYLASTTSVRFGSSPGSISSVSETQIRVTVPPGALGIVDVAVTSAAGTSVVPAAFAYLTPVIPSWATLIEAAPDPAVILDPSLRQKIVETGWAWRVRDNATQIEMLLIPPGTFQMGCIMGSDQHGCYGWDQPVHRVTLTNPYYLGRYEVTQSQWVARIGSNPSYFQGSSRPVDQVSWNDTQLFMMGTGLRLPTEAEWEYACRAGTQTPFYNGSTEVSTLGGIAWFGACCGGNSGGQTHPVGGKAANGFGLHDMLGNAGEYVNDWFSNTYYASSPTVNPPGPSTGTQRTVRGGTWADGAYFVNSSNRGEMPPENYHFGSGFRVAREP